MKTIYHIYFDCNGSVLVGEETTSTSSIISLTNAYFIDSKGIKRSLKECHVNRDNIAFYYVECKYEDE